MGENAGVASHPAAGVRKIGRGDLKKIKKMRFMLADDDRMTAL